MTYRNYIRANVKFILTVTSVLIFISFSLFTMSCADNPTSLGLKFVPPGDTIGVKVFDSYKDTMQIYSVNRKKYVNTSGSSNLIVGQSGNYSSKALIKFINLPTNFDSAVINSAVLKLWYRNYYFPASMVDSLAQISFNVYTVQQNVNYFTITLDSVNTTLFGTTPQGSYIGAPKADSQEVDIPLNLTLVRNWLYNVADTNHGAPNYGIALIPNSSSRVLKGFYSNNQQIANRPTLSVILTKNNTTDTLTMDASQNLSLMDADFPTGSPTFLLQAGIGYVQVVRFDLSKIPSTAVINDAKLFLTLDSVNSQFTNQTSYSIVPSYRDDTTLVNFEGLSASDYGNPSGGQYIFRLILPFQRWVQGQANYGLLLNAYNQKTNLDKFAFYDVNASDPNKRPRVIIKYTPRTSK